MDLEHVNKKSTIVLPVTVQRDLVHGTFPTINLYLSVDLCIHAVGTFPPIS
jgi:hypothetical protein